MRPNASENEQISPTTTIPVARGVDSRPHLASILQEGRKSTNIHAGSGVIWGIPAGTSMIFTACSILITATKAGCAAGAPCTSATATILI